MARSRRARLWIEAAGGLLSLALAVVTLFSREWIEVVFRVDPDRGSGALEWAFVAATLALSAACSALARREWRRAATA